LRRLMSAEIGRRIRTLRKERGLSQEDVARRTEIGIKAYGDLERGRTQDPHYSTLLGIARALDVPVEDLIREPVPLDEAPMEVGQAEALTAEVTQIQQWYRARRDGLVLLCERWEQRLASLGEDPDGEMLREMLDDMTIVGTYLTDFFEKAAIDETAEIWTALGSVDNKGAGLTDNAAFATATKVSIMKPALERWQRLGNEIHRRGVEKFGEAAAYVEFPEIPEMPPAGRDELAKRRAEKLRRAS
jgi:transcriptional regulator with XRE-family HTH domain